MRTTDELKREHVHIKVALRVLGDVATRMDRGEPVPGEDVEALLEFLTVYADKCHHAKEEDCLFPALLAKGMPREGGPIGIMLDEHVTGRACIRRMREAAGRDPAGFSRSAREYIPLLTDHISREDDLLFPLADDTLTRDEDFRIAQEFQAFEVDRIGAGRHDELEAKLARLEARYAASGGA